MDAWILDESPGSYRWGTIDAPALRRDDVQIRVVTERAQPHGPVGDAWDAQTTAAARAGLRRRRRGRGGRRGRHRCRGRRRGGRQSRGLPGCRHRRPRQRQPDGARIRDLRRAHVGRPCHLRGRSGTQRVPTAGRALVGGVRGLPPRHVDGVPDAQAGAHRARARPSWWSASARACRALRWRSLGTSAPRSSPRAAAKPSAARRCRWERRP